MTVPVLLFALGLVLLIKGGDWFVDGSTGIARRFGLPELLIGATVVSIGTTLPEVMVSTTSALSGHGEIAYGNAIGSVICNTALIAAITVAIRPGKVDPKTLRLPVAFFFTAAAVYAGIAYTTGYFSQISGFIMLAMFVVYMAATIWQMKSDSNSRPRPAAQPQTEESSILKDILMIVAGAALIAVGANLLVDNGTLIAQALGVPESVIALTFVALGTSLPELAASIVSLVKGRSAMALGNAIGSNIANILLILGLSATIRPLSMGGITHADLAAVLSNALLLWIAAFTFRRRAIDRTEGALFLLLYAAYLWHLLR